MRAGSYRIIVGILVLIAGLVMGQHSYVHQASFVKHSEIALASGVRHQQLGIVKVTPVLSQGESSDHGQHKEKRHGKSLVSQAIAADCPIVLLPSFCFYQRHYSLFLPGGCTRLFIGNFSLRGPPAC